MTVAPPLELTAEEFLDLLEGLDETPPCVPTEHHDETGAYRIKRAAWVDYPMREGGQCEAIVFEGGLILVSATLWEILQ